MVNKMKEENYKTIIRAVTIPKWLNDKAKQSKINVSGVLQKALIEILCEGKKE